MVFSSDCCTWQLICVVKRNQKLFLEVVDCMFLQEAENQYLRYRDESPIFNVTCLVEHCGRGHV